jgi:type VI secretion system protein ImpK
MDTAGMPASNIELIPPSFFKAPASSLHLHHLPLTAPQTYYRTKFLTVSTNVNPLVGAAATLLSLIAYLKNAAYLDSRELYYELIHEVKAFETQAQAHGYRSEIILIARYVLCTALDEMMDATSFENKRNSDKQSLLIYFHGEIGSGERIFLILERLNADPALHLDILELIYICLSFGLLGKYQQFPENKTKLDNIVEKLYQTIRFQRGDIKKSLLVCEESQQAELPIVSNPLPTWLLITFISVFLLTLYIVFNAMLENSILPIFQQLMQLYG